MKIDRILPVITFGALFCCKLSAATDGEGRGIPDGITLLEGVRSARLQIPPSELIMEFQAEDRFAGSAHHKLQIIFADERRFFSEKNHNRLALYDGEKAVIYFGENMVGYRNLDSSFAQYLFDPRTIGLNPANSMAVTVDSALAFRNGGATTVVGREAIDGREVWHVRVQQTNTWMQNTYEQQTDVWVDSENGFRVYLFEQRTKGFGRSSVRSFYDNSEYPFLPSRTIQKDFVENATSPVNTRINRVLDARIAEVIKSDQFSLAALGIKYGAEIHDDRNASFVGWWDGKKLVDERPPTQVERVPVFKRVVFFIVASLLVVAGAILVSLRNKTLEQVR